MALALLLVIGAAVLLLGGEEQPPPDTRPPDTAISGEHPRSVPEGESITFEFTSTESGSTFECSVDGGTSAACSSPHTVSPLPVGEHSLAIAATDRAGNTDLTPVTHHFTVEGITSEGLMAHVPEDAFTDCSPYSEDLPDGTVEAAYCYTAEYDAYYYLFDSRANLDAYVQVGINYYDIEEGDCAAGEFGYGEWVYNADPNVSVGELLCGTAESGSTVVESSLWSENIYLEVYGDENQPLGEVFDFWTGVVPQ